MKQIDIVKLVINDYKKRSKKLEGVEEVMVPGERGDKIRSKIIDSNKIEVEDNLLNSLISFVEGN